MNKRRTKCWFGERGSIGRPLFGRLCSLSRRSVPSALLLLAVAFALLSGERAWGAGYTMLDNDRILLMNNDNKFLAKVESQGYYDTNTASKTYWVHDKVAPPLFSAALLTGVTHTRYKNDGTRLWHLEQCRAGSGTVVNNSRNYIPWTTSARSIIDGSTGIPFSSAGEKSVGSVSMRNAENACIYSPLYTGIWGCVIQFFLCNHLSASAALDTASSRWLDRSTMSVSTTGRLLKPLMLRLAIGCGSKMWTSCNSRKASASLCRPSQSKVQTIIIVSTLLALGFCTLSTRPSQKYKSLTKFQRFRCLAFVLS